MYTIQIGFEVSSWKMTVWLNHRYKLFIHWISGGEHILWSTSIIASFIATWKIGFDNVSCCFTTFIAIAIMSFACFHQTDTCKIAIQWIHNENMFWWSRICDSIFDTLRKNSAQIRKGNMRIHSQSAKRLQSEKREADEKKLGKTLRMREVRLHYV